MATIISNGTKAEILNRNLTANDDTQIGFTQPVNSVTIKCRTSVDIQVRTTRGASDYYTIPSTQALTLYMSGDINSSGVVQPLNLWLRSATGSVVAEIIGMYGG